MAKQSGKEQSNIRLVRALGLACIFTTATYLRDIGMGTRSPESGSGDRLAENLDPSAIGVWVANLFKNLRTRRPMDRRSDVQATKHRGLS